MGGVTDEQRKRVIFGLAKDDDGNDIVVFGITQRAWDQMANQKTADFDLTKVGIPLKVVLFRGDTYEDVMATITAGAKAVGADIVDHTKQPDRYKL